MFFGTNTDKIQIEIQIEPKYNYNYEYNWQSSQLGWEEGGVAQLSQQEFVLVQIQTTYKARRVKQPQGCSPFVGAHATTHKIDRSPE